MWITDLYSYAHSSNRGIRMVVWFNEDKETDWAVFGGVNGEGNFRYSGATYKTYSDYKSAVTRSAMLSSNSGTPRLLTDLQFTGQ